MTKPDALDMSKPPDAFERLRYYYKFDSKNAKMIIACAEVAEEMEQEQMRAAAKATITGDSSLERQALHKCKIMGDFIERLRSVVEGER